jgi:DNA repair protein RadC
MARSPYPCKAPPALGQGALQVIHLHLEARELPVAVASGGDVVHLVRPHCHHLHREAFFAVPVNGRHQPLGIHLVSMGTTTSAPVHPRDVFLPAVLAGATALIVAHNHPSGDPTPSTDDRLVTERLRQAGELLGIELLDHIVIGRASYFSFAAEQTIPFVA